ncbi:MAG TPA: RNA methyltransferase [Burkholderiales bacterium]|nr:RNA methyltransferase [Burkholderiales bacterium]
MSAASVRIVLSRPTHPGNIGATARAMKNMGLSELVLVAPLKYPHADAIALAADAGDVLDRARVCATLEEAVNDCQLVIGTSARSRRIGWPELDTVDCAQRLVTAAAQGPAALVFGQERTGLTNDELDQCQYVVTIPTSPEYPSINLAGAVQILVYEILRAGHVAFKDDREPEQPLATAEELQLFYEHLERVLVRIEFLDPNNPRLLMRRLMRLYGRAQIDRNELNILRGILTSIEKSGDRQKG